MVPSLFFALKWPQVKHFPQPLRGLPTNRLFEGPPLHARCS